MLSLPKNAKREDILTWADQWLEAHFHVDQDDPIDNQVTALLAENQLEFCTIKDACQKIIGPSDYIKSAKCLRFNIKLSTWLLGELKKIYLHDFQQLAKCEDVNTLYLFEKQISKLSALLAIGSAGLENFQLLFARLINQIKRHQNPVSIYAPVTSIPTASIKAFKDSIDEGYILLDSFEVVAEHIKENHTNADDIQRLRTVMGAFLRLLADGLHPYHMEANHKGRSFDINQGDDLILLSMPFSANHGEFPKFNGCYSLSVSILQNTDNAQLGMHFVIDRMVDVTIHPFWYAEQTEHLQDKLKTTPNGALGLTDSFIKAFTKGEQRYYQPSLLFDARVAKSIGNFNEYSLILQSWVELCHHNVVPQMFIVDDYHNAAKLWALGFEPYECEHPTLEQTQALAQQYICANTLDALAQDNTSLRPPQDGHERTPEQPQRALRLFHFDMCRLTTKVLPAFSQVEPKTWADKIAQSQMLNHHKCKLPNIAGIPVRPILPSFVQLQSRTLGIKPVNQLFVSSLALEQKLLDNGAKLAQLGSARTNRVLADTKNQFNLVRK